MLTHPSAEKLLCEQSLGSTVPCRCPPPPPGSTTYCNIGVVGCFFFCCVPGICIALNFIFFLHVVSFRRCTAVLCTVFVCVHLAYHMPSEAASIRLGPTASIGNKKRSLSTGSRIKAFRWVYLPQSTISF